MHTSTAPLILSMYRLSVCVVYVFFDETYKLKLIIFLHLVLRRNGHSIESSKATLDTHNGTLLGMNGKKEMLHAEVDSCMRKATARSVCVCANVCLSWWCGGKERKLSTWIKVLRRQN